MQHFLFVQPFQDFLIMSFLTSQEICLRGDGVLPLLRVFLVLLVGLFGLFFQFLELLLLPVDGLYFLLDFPDLHTVDPNILALLVGDVLTKPDLVVADSLPHLVPLHLVTLDDVLQHLMFASL